MNPAFSVIFFTTLSGAGYGLLFWSGLAALVGGASARSLLHAALLGCALTVVGLLSSLFHLGKPQRAWRAFSQWRTSWLSREGVLAVLTFVPAVLFALMMLPAMIGAHPHGAPVGLHPVGMAVAVLLMACALATVACTAMIYASLTPIPAWRHPLVLPAYLLFALLTGLLTLGALAAIQGAPLPEWLAGSAILLALALLVVKWRYWRGIDQAPMPLARGDAIGLPQRTAHVFERPHTEANYITREMAFVVARRHARWLRRGAMAAFALVPVFSLLPMWLFVHADAAPWLPIAAAGAMLGAVVERWLFFAEAKHLVTLYY